MRGKVLRLSNSSAAMLMFLWKWKLATTATLAQIFRGNSSIDAYYRILLRFEKAKYIRSVVSRDGNGFVWMLDKDGFTFVKDRLPELVEDGFLSENVGHDLLSLAAQLGYWVKGCPPGCEIITEQALRRIAKDSLPTWVPRSNIHRPDGYWHINDGNQTRLLALEVELNQKKLDDYETVGRFYSKYIECDGVIWIIGKRVSAKSINGAISKAISAEQTIHSFITLEEFIKNHWHAKVSTGNGVGRSIVQLLSRSSAEAHPQPDTTHFFDTRKYPIKSATKQNLETHHFFQVTGTFPF